MVSAAGMGLITGGIGVGLSAIDIIRGERMRKQNEAKLKNLQRPMMGVTDAQAQQVALGQQMSTQNMAGYDIAQNQIQTQGAQTLANVNAGAQSSADLMAAATNLGMNNTNALNDLAMQNAQSKRQGMLNYQEQLGGLAETQQQMFMMNKYQPFQEKREQYQQNIQQGRELVNAGMQGIGGAVGQSMPLLSAGFGNDSWKRFSDMYGSKTV
jgi:hypothetical protein